MKRLVDIVGSCLALSLLSPAFLILAVLVRVNLGSPILFAQIRPGVNGQKFKLLKFRSMKNTRDENGQLLPDSERITPFGRLLRASSLDELPEFWNVLKGDMSLVGPRPLLVEYLPLYSEIQFRRHDVRPGITGWAQINGRNSISWEERFAYDLWYVNNKTIYLDFKIIWITIKKVILCENITARGDATMPKFNGRRNH